MLERSQDVCPMLISQIDIRNLWPRKKETIEIDGEHVVTVIYIYIYIYIMLAGILRRMLLLYQKKEQNDCKPLN
jgi:hypothetical protein